jgi:hypothetical protein
MAIARELSEEVEERKVFSRVCRKGRVQADVLGAGSSRFRCKTRGKCLGSGDRRVEGWLRIRGWVTGFTSELLDSG